MRNVLTLGLAVVTVAIGAGRLHTQPPTPTRVAIVNIGLVFTKYDKAMAYKNQMEKLIQPYQVEGMKLKKEVLEWAETMKNPKFDPALRERYEDGIKGNKRKLEDLEMQVKKLIGKTQEDQITNLFKEVNTAIQAYARANGIHVVLGYGEQIDGDPFSFANINRKMQGMDLSICNPIYQAPGIDISQQVADTLNTAFQRAGGSTQGNIIPTSATQPVNKN